MAKRPYGSGRLYEVEGKRGVVYYGTWWSGGRRVKRRIGSKRAAGASDGLTQVQAERELRRLIEREVVRPRAERRTFEQAADAYVDHLEHVMERKRSTIQDYRGYLSRHLVPFFGDRAIDRVDTIAISQYLRRKRADGLSSKTVQNHLNFLHGVFAFAVKRGWAPLNPVAHVDRPKRSRSPHTRVRFLQPHELDAMIRAVPDDTLGPVERPLYLTAALTGARQGELLALRWADVDWVAQRLRIADNYTRGRWGTTKSHESRSVPLADRVARELDLLSKRSRYRSDTDLVFCHPLTGNVLDPSRLRKRFAEALESARVNKITFHELRHTFGTQMAAAGAPLRAIQEWMGHADAKTTEIYRHYAPDPTHGAELVERAFARKGSNSGSNMSESNPVQDSENAANSRQPEVT
jgi:integrase